MRNFCITRANIILEFGVFEIKIMSEDSNENWDDIKLFKPNELSPEFIIMTEFDSIHDYIWVNNELKPDLTIILYPNNLWTKHFRSYINVKQGSKMDSHDINSAWYALTNNKHGFGMWNTLLYRYFGVNITSILFIKL